MTRRKKGHSKDTDALWSRKFDDNEGYTKGNHSRIDRKKADKAISPIMKSLWIFLALFIILPTGVFLWYSYNEQNNVQPPETENVVVKENESKESQKQPEKESESNESEETESSSESEEESTETQENETNETEVAVVQEEPVESQEPIESQVPESSVSEETQPAESESEEQTNTYTVQAGDNLYRIALNHGMTTEELKALNGITSDSVSPGTVLVVK